MRQRRVAIIAASMIIVYVVIIVGVALSGLGQSGPPPMPTVSPYTVETGSPFVDSLSHTRGWGDAGIPMSVRLLGQVAGKQQGQIDWQAQVSSYPCGLLIRGHLPNLQVSTKAGQLQMRSGK